MWAEKNHVNFKLEIPQAKLERLSQIIGIVNTLLLVFLSYLIEVLHKSRRAALDIIELENTRLRIPARRQN